jgi:hypothetical protein
MDEQIHDNALRIAVVLRRGRKTSHVPGWLARNVRYALHIARRRPAIALYDTLRQIHRQMDEPRLYKRDYLLCRSLIESLWMIPPGSSYADEVVRFAREKYQSCDRPFFRERLRDEMKSRQWSSFSNERRAIGRLLEVEPVTAQEIEILRDWDAYPDLRQAVALRAILHLQVEHLDAIVRYCVRVVCQVNAPTEESGSVGLILDKFADFDPVDAVKPLFLAYLENYENTLVRGELLRALIRFGDVLIDPLMAVYAEQPEERIKVLRLMRQLTREGSVVATDQLCKLVHSELGAELEMVCEQLYQGISDYVSKTPPNEQSSEVLGLMDALRDELRDSQQARHHDLLKRMAEILARPEDLPRETVERLVSGRATIAERRSLARGSFVTLELLVSLMTDKERPVSERTRAVEFIGQVSAARFYPELGNCLWKLVCAETDPELRIAALNTLPRTRWNGVTGTREALMQIYANAPERLRSAIIACWPRVLLNVAPPAVADKDTTNSEGAA